MSLYEEVGGEPVFRQLVDAFYDGVEHDPVLRPLYPEGDLQAARDRLRMFLEQYWGGPTTYSDSRGHPRLRMRHVPFTIGVRERDAWYSHMAAAVQAGGLSHDDEAEMLSYFANAATHLINEP
ncbi:MAG: hemoglobin [Actinomycetota bacterium]